MAEGKVTHYGETITTRLVGKEYRSLSLDTDHIVFPSIEPGDTATKTITLTNEGDNPVELGETMQELKLNLPFIVKKNTCSEVTLHPKKTCSITILFGPRSAGSFHDNFDIPLINGLTALRYIISVDGKSGDLPLPPSLVYPSNNATGVEIPVTLQWNQSYEESGESLSTDQLNFKLTYCKDSQFTGCTPIDVTWTMLDEAKVTPTTLFIILLTLIATALLGQKSHHKKNLCLIMALVAVISLGQLSCGSNDTKKVPNAQIANIDYTLSDLDPNTTYYWKVGVQANSNDLVESPTWSFTTGE
jgi:hypothetical protein